MKTLIDAAIDLVLIGGGHSHVQIVKMMGMDPIPGVRVTLVSRDVESPYSGMIPGYVAGFYTRDECHIDLLRLCSFSNTRFINAEVCDIDINSNLLHCKDGRPPISYDYLSINIGITPQTVPSNDTNASTTLSGDNITPVKPIDKFARKWNDIMLKIKGDEEARQRHIAIVGGGAGGVELAFAVHHRLTELLQQQSLDPTLIKVALYNRGSSLLSSHNKWVMLCCCSE